MRLIATDVARSVVCVFVCWAHRWAVLKKAEPIEMPFRGLAHVSPRTMYWIGSKANESIRSRDDWQVCDAAFSKLLWTLAITTVESQQPYTCTTVVTPWCCSMTSTALSRVHTGTQRNPRRDGDEHDARQRTVPGAAPHPVWTQLEHTWSGAVRCVAWRCAAFQCERSFIARLINGQVRRRLCYSKGAGGQQNGGTRPLRHPL